MAINITLEGGFHNASPITLRIRNNQLSEGQYKRLSNHMCGIKGCICGWRGYEITGMSREAFNELTMDAAFRAADRRQ